MTDSSQTDGIEQINKMLSNIDFGEVTFNAVKHKGNITKIEINNRAQKFAPADNAQAGGIMLQTLKNAADSEADTDITFQVKVRGGTIKLLTIQEKETAYAKS